MRQNPTSGRRTRGRSNRGRPHGPPNRHSNFESNGPEGRVRGNATQVFEKYLSLAREAMTSGDRVLAEAFHQHAEHYCRIINESTDPRADNGSAPQRANGADHRDDEQSGGRREPRQQRREERNSEEAAATQPGATQPSAPQPDAPQPDAPQPEVPPEAMGLPQGARAPRDAAGDSAGAAPGDTAEASPESPAAAENTETPRRRGRPRKFSLEARSVESRGEPRAVESPPAGEDSPAPRRRGRPRKQPIEAEKAEAPAAPLEAADPSKDK